MFFGVVLVDVIGLHSAQDGLVLPLVATQILWINLVTDGAPALALGIDPADPGGMNSPPRPRGEGVITFRMWAGIFFVGAIMAAGTLIVLDAALPGGLIEGSGSVSYGQTMAFTTLTLFQLFNVFNARSDERSAFGQLFTNRWLWGAVALSVCLHTAVIYMPVLRNALSTTPLSAYDWAICASVASLGSMVTRTKQACGRDAGRECRIDRRRFRVTIEKASGVKLDLEANWPQFSLLVLINAFVGGMVDIERTVVPLVVREGAWCRVRRHWWSSSSSVSM